MGNNKKYYAVRTGRKTGLFTTWDECKDAVHGFKGAVYKGFETMEEARQYLAGASTAKEIIDGAQINDLPEVYAFTDGSYNVKTKVYGYGGFLVAKGERFVLQGNGSDPELASMRNVAGEIAGSEAAVRKAMELGLKELSIYYDYAGIEQWATGGWKANKEGTVRYRDFFESIKNKIKVNFVKVRGHAGIEGNEEADRLAKDAVGVV